MNYALLQFLLTFTCLLHSYWSVFQGKSGGIIPQPRPQGAFPSSKAREKRPGEEADNFEIFAKMSTIYKN